MGREMDPDQSLSGKEDIDPDPTLHIYSFPDPAALFGSRSDIFIDIDPDQISEGNGIHIWI